ncbi:hypothetical protein GGS20DRAFT_588678 [Poronia punctata]|nr:hypothetical protein GGS20DRAFT_588678 [Poronia punctata]
MSYAPGRHGPHQDLTNVEAEYWQNTKKARDQEDATLEHDHSSRQGKLDHILVELYKERSHLADALKNIDATIEYRREEKQRLSHEYETKRAQLLAERLDEDRSKQGWFSRARVNTSPRKENTSTTTKTEVRESRERVLLPLDHSNISSSNPAAPDHVVAHPNPSSSWTTVNSTTSNPLRRSPHVRDERRDHGDLFGNIFHNPVEEVTLPPLRLVTAAHPNSDRLPPPPSQTDARVAYDPKRPGVRAVRPKTDLRSLPPFPSVKGDPPSDSRRSSQGRRSLPSVGDSASQPNSPAPESVFVVDQDKEITRETLVLKDNGHIIFEPPMFAGVPLERIDTNHPLWNPEWEPLEQTIQASLEKWREKHEKLRQDPSAVRHTMFLANRQVNRGQTVLDFLKDGPFHPLQFVGREMMDKYYKTFINYDTVFRLVNIHEELKKFDLDVTPLQWLRQRMYEIAEKQGDKFSLSKTTHDLYHDEKLKYLREKHGFGNIGRPSGYKLGSKMQAKGTTAAKLKPKKETTEAPKESERARPTRRSIDKVDADDQLPRSTTTADEYLEPVTPGLPNPKRRRLSGSIAKPESRDAPSERERESTSDNLDYEGYTSQDSFSAGRIMQLDFRLLQIKTELLSTPADVTQYWTYKPDEAKFEHRIVRDERPNVTWSSYGEPEGFSCKLGEMKEIHYAAGSLKIVVVTSSRDQGRILVAFKRERTKRRFLAFANKKGIILIKSSPINIDEKWKAMEPEMASAPKSKA